MAVKAGELRTAGDVVLWWLGQVEQHREQLERAGLVPVTGPAADYQGNNKKGAGGAHRTGD